MKKLFIIAAIATLICILCQGNEAKAQRVTGKLVYGIARMQNTGEVKTFIRGDGMAAKFISQGLFETNVKVGDYFAVEFDRKNSAYNGTLSWKTGNILQTVSSGNDGAVFHALAPGPAVLAITPEGQSNPSIVVQVIVSQSQSQPQPTSAGSPAKLDPAIVELQKQVIEYRKKGLHNQALQALNQGIQTNSNNAVLYLQRGITHLNMKNSDLAIADLNQALSLAKSPKFASYTYFWRGCAYGLKKQYDAALKDFNEALKSNPNANTYYWRGITYQNKGQYLPAINDFDQAIKLSPSDPRPYFGKASALDKSGQSKEALEAYRVYLRFARDPKTIQRANERISELKDEIKPVATAKPKAKKPEKTKEPKGQAETEIFAGPLGEEAF